MSKTLKAFILICIFIFLLSSYFLLKGHYEQHKYDINKIPTKRTNDYGSILCSTFERKNWDGLPLSENFREKYKTKFDITEYAENFVRYSNGYKTINEEQLIVIIFQKEYLFDFEDKNGYQIDLYFRYKTTEDGLLDDVELVRREKSNKMTGRIIEEWDYDKNKIK